MKLAIIGAGPMAKIIATKAKSMGIEVHCFAWALNAVAKDYVDVFHDISILEKETILNICVKESINGVVATTELTIPVAAYIAEKLCLTGIPLEIAERITEKNWVRKKIVNAKSISQPWFMHCKDAEDSESVSMLSFPVIIKPVSEGGKRGVIVAENQTEYNAAIQFAMQADKHNKGVLIEEYLSGGKEYSVESISFRGNHQVIQVTEKISSGPPHCVELGHSQPANIAKEIREQVVVAVKELLDLVEIKNGPSHTEIKIIDDKIYLIELNSRPGGDHIASPLTMLSTGYDYIASIILVALGIEPPIKSEATHIKYAGVRFIAEQTKELKSIFDTCDDKAWLYEKHIETEQIEEIKNNNGFHLNYFIYCDDQKPEF